MEFQKRLRELREELGLSHVRAIQTITPKGIVVKMEQKKDKKPEKSYSWLISTGILELIFFVVIPLFTGKGFNTAAFIAGLIFICIGIYKQAAQAEKYEESKKKSESSNADEK